MEEPKQSKNPTVEMSDAEFGNTMKSMVPNDLQKVETQTIQQATQRFDLLMKVLARATSLEAFLAKPLPPLEFFLGDFAVHPGVGLIFGPAKTGKSWLALGLALGLASGTTVLGFTPPRKYSVVLVDGENGERIVHVAPALRIRQKCGQINIGNLS